MPSFLRPQNLSGSVRPGAAETYPASLAQRRLWFLNQLQPCTAAYNVHIGLWLYGPLDLAALQSSLQHIIARHESLRTTFVLVKGELLQVVSPTEPISLPRKDFSAEPDPYPPAYAFARHEVGTPFDLSAGRLFRSHLMRIAPEEHVLLCTMHHTVTDAWSLQVFAKEVAACYEALKKGKPPDLPELAIQYGDYSEWQQLWLDSESAQNQLAFWKQNLANAPALLDLTPDVPRPAEQMLEGQTRSLAIPPEIMADVMALAKRRQVTPFMILLAAFKTLLYRYSGQPDILVGVPVAGRSRIETEPLIGFFVDTVVLRDNLSGNLQFLDLLAQVRETTVNALANAEVPFEKVVEILRPERNLSFNPIFQVMFSVIKSAIRSHTFGDIVAYPYVVEPSTAILDLGATFIEDSDGKWWLQFDFNTSLFQYERVLQMFNDFMEILTQINRNPAVPIDELAVSGAPQITGPGLKSRREGSESKSVGETVPARRSKAVVAANQTEEELLIEIWKEVLGLDAVGIHDNFFDVGGHSLLAARLTAQIHQATDRSVPVSAIFRAPTVAKLAEFLRLNVVSSQESLILQLREGKSRIPFFAVAAPAVDSLGFALLARHIDGETPMYKLQGSGPGVWARPYTREELRTLAREYVRAMRSVQPQGPYCLGGMCDGVHIAQEMILQLEAEREQVALFAILDTWVLENSQVRALWLLNYYLDRIRHFPRLPRTVQLATLRRTFRRWVGENRNQDWNQVYWPGDDFVSPQFRAPVMLFKRPRQPYYYVRDPEMGWGIRSSGGIQICEVNCGHFELLRVPHVQRVGRKLSDRLREINDTTQAQAIDAGEAQSATGTKKAPVWLSPAGSVTEEAAKS